MTRTPCVQLSLPRVGMDRVEGGGYRRHYQTALGKCIPDTRAHLGFDDIRQVGIAGSFHIEVDLRETVRRDGIENTFERWLGKRSRENPEVIHALTRPFTSTSRLRRTASSTASSKLTAAHPSASSGLVGRFSKIARPKASI